MFIHQGCITLIKSDTVFCTVNCFPNKSCSWTVLHKNAKTKVRRFSTLIIRNVSINIEWFLKDHVTLVAKSNSCWKFSFAITGINYILKYIKKENCYFKPYYVTILLFSCIFDQINAALVDRRQKMITILNSSVCLFFVSYFLYVVILTFHY